MILEWQKCFELRDGSPTGRWQWILDEDDGSYVFPGIWLEPDNFAVPPELERSTPRRTQ